MNLLLDTHIFLWWILDAPELSKTVHGLISNSSNNVFWSAASTWEVAIKYALRRLPLPETPEKFLPVQLEKNRIESLPITNEHAIQAGQLPHHHRDPFDRMLIAQAQIESLVLLSTDSQFKRYDVEVRW